MLTPRVVRLIFAAAHAAAIALGCAWGRACHERIGAECPPTVRVINCIDSACSITDGSASASISLGELRVRRGTTLRIETTLAADTTALTVGISSDNPDAVGTIATTELSSFTVSIDGAPAQPLTVGSFAVSRTTTGPATIDIALASDASFDSVLLAVDASSPTPRCQICPA